MRHRFALIMALGLVLILQVLASAQLQVRLILSKCERATLC